MVTVGQGIEEAYFPDEVNERVPYMLRTLCGFWTVLIVVALLTVSNFKKTDEELRLFHQLEENLFP